MTVDPPIRRANRWLFIGLIVFALGFCAAILLWMRVRTVRKGGKVYPPVSMMAPGATRPLLKTIAFVDLPDFSSIHAL